MNRHDMESFERDVQIRRQAGYGHKEGSGPLDPWEEIAQGRNLGKSVPINFLAAGFGGQLLTAQAEILRIMPRGDRQDIAKQICLTVSPPQRIAAANVPATIPQSIQGQDTIDIAGAGAVGGTSGGAFGPTGGFPVSASSIAEDFQWANAVVLLQWGIGSVNNRAVVDCSNGLTVNLVANSLIVTAAIEQIIGQGPSPGLYIIGANIGPGTPRNNNAQRTIGCGFLVANAVSSCFPVPRFASSVRVAGCDGSHDGILAPALPVGTIQFFADPNRLVAMGDFAFNGNQTNPIPIPNGAYFFDIVSGSSTAAGGGMQFLATFSLNI